MKVLLADDHPLLRDALRGTLFRVGGLIETFEAGDFQATHRACAS